MASRRNRSEAGAVHQPDGKLSGSPRARAGGRGEVSIVIAVAAEGTAVYYTANGVLAANENGRGEHAQPGNCEGLRRCVRLYRYQPASGGTPASTTFVANVRRAAAGNNDVGRLGHPGTGADALRTRPRTAGSYCSSSAVWGSCRYDARTAA